MLRLFFAIAIAATVLCAPSAALAAPSPPTAPPAVSECSAGCTVTGVSSQGGQPVVQIHHSGISPAITYSCSLTPVDGKYYANYMWAQGGMNCTISMVSMDISLYLWHCQPIAWGCVWVQWYQLGSTCGENYTSSEWCPSSGAFISGVIGTGSALWQVREKTNVIAPDESSSSATAIGNTLTY